MLEVSTGSRLHFGLFELAAGQPRRYGGLGMMVSDPGWVLEFSPGSGRITQSTDKPVDDLLQRIQTIRSSAEDTNRDSILDICVRQSVPLHCGLGAGTQLAAATCFGLAHYPSHNDHQPRQGTASPALMDINTLMHRSHRGKRSSIGLFGFMHGGLIMDAGHHPLPDRQATEDQQRTIVAERVLTPDAWRIVTIAASETVAITGEAESQLMDQAARMPNPHRDRMFDLAQHSLVHAQSGDFASFVDGLQTYLDLAGQLFANCQGGQYHGAAATEAAALARQCGLRAVGQSSWGPTIFGFAEHQQAAEDICRSLYMRCPKDWNVCITQPMNSPARWRWRNTEECSH